MEPITENKAKGRGNPFFDFPYATPHGTAPFNDIRQEDYEPAFMEGIRQDEALTDSIADNPDTPTFDNTIAVDVPDNLLGRVSDVFFNLLSAETNDEMDALAQKISPILTEHANNILLNKKLFERVKAVHECHRPLTQEEQTLLDKEYDGFIRNGAALAEEDKEKLRGINKELSRLTLQFSQNNLKATNAFQLHLTCREDLSGLPETSLDAAATAAREKGLEGWLFTLHAPSYNPFMTYADNRQLRERMYMAKNTICTEGHEYDNSGIVKSIVNLRRERAQLLGYRTYADFVLQNRMAENSQNVYKLLNDLLEAYLPAARQEVKEVEDTARRHEGADFKLRPWDFGYYAHKLQLEKYDIDAEMLRPYF